MERNNQPSPVGAQGVRLSDGDIFVLRTGHHRRHLELGPWDNNVESRAVLHPSTLRLLKGQNVAAFAADGDGETIPNPVGGISYPMHSLQITAMGMAAFDNLQFEDLREVWTMRAVRSSCSPPVRFVLSTGRGHRSTRSRCSERRNRAQAPSKIATTDSAAAWRSATRGA